MPESLGEKLRQAREERDITLSEVAEQTRISPLYIESIENDNYKPLPGGIFNKGFVKSFAKYVGVDEQEALQDYARLIASQEGTDVFEDPQTYRPEVLTDDRNGGSMLPTIIIAVIILGLMTWGVLALVNYLQNTDLSAATDTEAANTNVSENTNSNVNANINQQQESVPSTNEIKIKLEAVDDEVSITSTTDGKTSNNLLRPDSTSFDIVAQNSVRLKYAKSRAEFLNLTLNGRKIDLPKQPQVANSTIIDFEINKENIKSILQSSAISLDTPGNGNINTAGNTSQ